MNLPNSTPPRSREVYAAALDSLDVEHAMHYQPGWGGEHFTHCNALVADACALLGVRLPLLLANDQADWLAHDGVGLGWLELVSPAAATAAANLGQPTVAVWKNLEGPHGHIALVRPSDSGLRICQAGARNFNDAPFSSGFGTLEARLFTHA